MSEVNNEVNEINNEVSCKENYSAKNNCKKRKI